MAHPIPPRLRRRLERLRRIAMARACWPKIQTKHTDFPLKAGWVHRCDYCRPKRRGRWSGNRRYSGLTMRELRFLPRLTDEY